MTNPPVTEEAVERVLGEREFIAIIMREFGKVPSYEGPDSPCDDPVTQGYGNALTNILAALRIAMSAKDNGQ